MKQLLTMLPAIISIIVFAICIYLMYKYLINYAKPAKINYDGIGSGDRIIFMHQGKTTAGRVIMNDRESQCLIVKNMAYPHQVLDIQYYQILEV